MSASNAFARFCTLHNVDTSNLHALDRAWNRFERQRERALRRDPELEAYAEQAQTASAWIESEPTEGSRK